MADTSRSHRDVDNNRRCNPKTREKPTDECAVQLCDYRQSKPYHVPGIKCHRFPKYESVCVEWIKFCQNPVLSQKTPKQVARISFYFVCSQHFKKSDYRKRRLLRLRVPSIRKPKPSPLKTPSRTSSSSKPSTSAAEYSGTYDGSGIASFRAAEIIKGSALDLSKIYANPELNRKHANEAIQTIVAIQSSVEQNNVLTAIGHIVDKFCFANDARNIKNDLKMLADPLQKSLSSEEKRMDYFKQMGSLPEVSIVKPQLAIFDIESIGMNFVQMPGVLTTLEKEHSNKMRRGDSTLDSFMKGQVWQEKESNLHGDFLTIPLALYFVPVRSDWCLNSPKGLAVFLTFPSLPNNLLPNKENHFLVGLLGADEFASIKTFLHALSISTSLLTGLKSVKRKGGQLCQVQFCLAFVHGSRDGLQKLLGLEDCMFCNESFQPLICADVKIEPNSSENVMMREFKCENFELHRDVVPDFNEDWLLKICTWNLYIVFMGVIPEKLSLLEANERFRTFSIHSPGKRDLVAFGIEGLGVWLESMNGEEVLRLVCYMPFVFSDYIPLKSDSGWRLFMKLREIVFSLLGSMEKEHISLLQNKIESYLTECEEYFPDGQLPNYFHAASHYPNAYEKFGPFEQLLAIRSAVDKICQNLQKLSVDLDVETLTEAFCWKQQMVMNERFLDQRGFSTDYTKDNHQSRKSPLAPAVLEQFDETSRYAIAGMKMVSFFCLEGEKFSPNSIVISGHSEEYLQFAKILHILLNDVFDTCLCVCQKFRTACFDKHYGSYRVVATEELEIVDLLQLEWKYPVHQIFTRDGSNFIVLKKSYQWID